MATLMGRPRLMRDERGEGEQLLGFVGERRRILALGAALLDARLEIHEAAELGVVEGMAGGGSFERGRLAVAGGAGLGLGPGGSAPELVALLDPQHAGIDGEVVLLAAGLRETNSLRAAGRTGRWCAGALRRARAAKCTARPPAVPRLLRSGAGRRVAGSHSPRDDRERVM
jgi:hypothetical protein